MIETDVLIIGAGVMGLSCANQLHPKLTKILIERNKKPGQEASSRNSEVIHSGIYYPHGSLKTEHCKVGRNELTQFCKTNQIPHRQCGKLVIANSKKDLEKLATLAKHCEYEVVPFQRLSRALLEKKFSFLRAEEALYFPLSGIFDSHAYIRVLEKKAIDREVMIRYETEFVRLIQKNPWVIEVNERGSLIHIKAQKVINAAGFEAAKIANQFTEKNSFEHRACRGAYFKLKNPLDFSLSTLVYPLPSKEGLGIHLTPDLSGQIRLGPDTEWSDSLEPDWEALKSRFLSEAQAYLPQLLPSNLEPGFVGIRPKLFVNGEAYRDFLVHEEEGASHLLGIESPGLTASLSLGRLIALKHE